MLLKEFRESLLNQLLAFLWRQWSTLGIMGKVDTKEEWIIDPEPLLVFSLEMGRYDPKLFDGILSWLWTNGHLIDTARLRKILLNRESEETARIVGGALHHVSRLALNRKWNSVIEFGREKFMVHSKEHISESLFKQKSEESFPIAEGKDIDPYFAEFGLNRPRIKILKSGQVVPINAHANIRFLLRSLFGVGARSECILYMLTHEAGHPNEIADSMGYFWLTLRDALEDLADSKLVLTRSRGKRLEYWLSHKKWWDFFTVPGYIPDKRPKWLNWIAIFDAFFIVWKTIGQIASSAEQDLLKEPKLQECFEILYQEFTLAGHDISIMPQASLPPDLYQQTVMKFFSEIFGLNKETTPTEQ